MMPNCVFTFFQNNILKLILQLTIRLLMDSGQLGQECGQERFEQAFAAVPGVRNELEKTQVRRKFLRGNTSMRTQSIAQ
jgi:hypothetical protein